MNYWHIIILHVLKKIMKKQEKISLDRFPERLTIIIFLRFKNITEETDFTQPYPDCVIPNISLVIEETSVNNFFSSDFNKI